MMLLADSLCVGMRHCAWPGRDSSLPDIGASPSRGRSSLCGQQCEDGQTALSVLSIPSSVSAFALCRASASQPEWPVCSHKRAGGKVPDVLHCFVGSATLLSERLPDRPAGRSRSCRPRGASARTASTNARLHFQPESFR